MNNVSEKISRHNRPVWESLAVSAMFSLSFFISSPFNVMSNNISNFEVSLLPDFIFRAVSLFVIGALVLWPILYIAMRFIKLGRAVVYSLLITFTLWLHFFPVSRGTLDGFQTLISAPSALITGFAFGAIFFILRKYAKIVFYAASIGPLVTALLFFVPFAIKTSQTPLVNTPIPLSMTENNFIVMSFDSLEADTVRHVLSKRPDLAKTFDGFTDWANVSTVAPFTYLSTQTTKLGYLTEGRAPKTAVDEFITQSMARNGHQVETYGLFNEEETKADNLTILADLAIFKPERDEYYQKALGASVINVMPYAALKTNTLLSKVFDFLGTSEDELARAIAGDISNSSVSYKQDISSYRGFVDELTTGSAQPTLRLHHYLFPHYPNTFDAACNYIAGTNKSGYNDQRALDIPTTECAVSIMADLNVKLKALGVYDNTTVFFTSDHGNECPFNEVSKPESYKVSDRWCLSRFMPFLLSKPPAASGEIKIRNENISLIDLPKTICENSNVENKGRLCAQHIGGDLFGSSEALQSKSRPILVGPIDGNSRDYLNNAIVEVGRGQTIAQYFNLEKDWSLSRLKPLQCDRTIKFDHSEFAGNGFYHAQGVGIRERWGRAIQDGSAEIFFKTTDKSCANSRLVLTLQTMPDIGPAPVTGRAVLNDGVPVAFTAKTGAPVKLDFALPSVGTHALSVTLDPRGDADGPVLGLIDMQLK